MHPIARNVIAVLAGVVLGSLVNLSLVNLGPLLIPLPEGVDVSSMESLRKGMVQFSPLNFLFPFLAHALGTLFGAYIAARFAASRPMAMALFIGVFFLAGGIAAASMIGGPHWFIVVDLLLAYLPTSLLGAYLARKRPAE
ncbi:MAG: hypothetical protein AAGJ52_10295 [Pseudomonadota bacterium]